MIPKSMNKKREYGQATQKATGYASYGDDLTRNWNCKKFIRELVKHSELG